MSIHELARRLDISHSFVSKIERGAGRPNARKAVRLAKELGLDATMTLMLWLKDSLDSKDRACVPLMTFPDHNREMFLRLWEFQASVFDIAMKRVTESVEVDLTGGAILQRTMAGIAPRKGAKPLARYSFREFIREDLTVELNARSVLEIVERPKGVQFEHRTIVKEKHITHVLSFPKGWKWSAKRDNSFTVKATSATAGAYYMDMETGLREYREAAIDRIPRNSYTFVVRNPVEELVLTVTLPQGYDPPAVGPHAWFGDGPIWENENLAARAVCLDREIVRQGQTWRLRIARPLVGFSYAIAWQPLERAEYLALKEASR